LLPPLLLRGCHVDAILPHLLFEPILGHCPQIRPKARRLMRFIQLDKITQFEAGSQLTAVKCLSLAEEYLQDHFPHFPVMPGVLMLEAMFQSSLLLWHKTDDFKYGMIVLKEARNVKFQDFVQPGKKLTITSLLQSVDGDVATFRTEGMLEDRKAVSARLLLKRFNIADEGSDEYSDQQNRNYFKTWFHRLWEPPRKAILSPELQTQL
jgi:3-hydroxyacyl-[acyl-carrier-protein] dehydratase